MEKINLESIIFNKEDSIVSFPTVYETEFSKKEYQTELANLRLQLSKLQDKMYAHNRYGVLLCFQGMDAAGKDSLIREVFKDFNARGVVVHSFKAPNTKELQHDFLWRHYLALPEKGKFSVFNRSHYENVLVTRVNPEFLLGERHPEIQKVDDLSDQFWQDRFESIRDFEKHCSRNGIIILKFYLHLSKDEQRKRLLKRIDEGKNNWKFDPSDVRDRMLWDAYMDCYEQAFQETSKENAPWYIIPADNKAQCRVIVAQTILETLKNYQDMQYPRLSPEIQDKLMEYREMLISDDGIKKEDNKER